MGLPPGLEMGSEQTAQSGLLPDGGGYQEETIDPD
jgi:hypothetical protein